jgi:hypothetical protein
MSTHERPGRGAALRGAGTCAMLLLATGSAACGGAGDRPARGAPDVPFESVFHALGRIQLEEPDSAAISGIRSLAVAPGGELLVLDRHSAQVRLYSREGRLLRSVGRYGEGPGEFSSPLGAAYGVSGELFVVDASRRVTRLAPDLALDTTFLMADTEFSPQVARVGERLLLSRVETRIAGNELTFYDRDGEWLGSFHPLDPRVYTVPYWNAWYRPFVAAGRDGIYVVSNMFYPIHRYTPDGEPVERFGTPPASWVEASRPKPGEFAGAGARQRYERWLRTFTSVSGLFLHRDSLLLVEHQRLDPSQMAYRQPSYRVDVYAPGGAKLLEDVALPGPILAAGDEIYLLVDEPPNPWTIERYTLALQPEHPVETHRGSD